jgi:hypothetical protein
MRRSAFFVALSLIGLAACGDSTAPHAAVAGSYALSTINDGALPYTLTESGGTVVFESGTIVLDGGGSFDISITATVNFPPFVIDQRQTSASTGTFTRNGSILTLTDADGEIIDLTIEGNTLTGTDEGVKAVWTRK